MANSRPASTELRNIEITKYLENFVLSQHIRNNHISVSLNCFREHRSLPLPAHTVLGVFNHDSGFRELFAYCVCFCEVAVALGLIALADERFYSRIGQ